MNLSIFEYYVQEYKNYVDLKQYQTIIAFHSNLQSKQIKLYETIKTSVECLKQNKVESFEKLRVVNSKVQAPHLKRF